MSNKKNIVFYSGHCEVVGGDMKYLFELIKGLDTDKFKVELYFDKNKEFTRKLKIDYPEFEHKVNYLDTRPELFIVHPSAKLAQFLVKKKDIFYLKPFYKFINLRYGNRSGQDILRFIYDWISLKYIRLHWHNFIIFYKFFKKQAKSIDIFHFNNGGYPAKEAGLLAVMLAKWFGIPKIFMTVHSVPVKRRWYRLSDYIFDYFVAKYSDAVIVASNVVRQELVKLRKYSPSKVKVIYCGLEDRKQLSQAEINKKKKDLNLLEDTQLLLISGNYDNPDKGHDVLFHAIATLRSKFPNLKLLIVGDGAVSRKQILDGLIKQLKIEQQVIFLGYRTDIHELNAIIDIAIVPTSHTEATPYTIKEASRAATPVITTTAGGCAEAVEDGETGLIVPPNNAAALAEAIAKLLADKALRARMGQAGRKLFLDRFLLADKINETIDLYLA